MLIMRPPYVNELFYSYLARNCACNGLQNNIDALDILYKDRKSIASFEVPNRINDLVKHPLLTPWSVDDILMNHSLFLFYSSFRNENLVAKAKEEFLNGNAANGYIKLGLTSSGVINNGFRFCKLCYHEDKLKHGEGYWHREHQISGLNICPKHKAPLYQVDSEFRNKNRQRFQPLNKELVNMSKQIIVGEKHLNHYIDLSIMIMDLLSYAIDIGLRRFKIVLKDVLIANGYSKLNNYVYQKRLLEDFRAFYGDDFLKEINCTVVPKSWIKYLVNNDMRSLYALKPLLLLNYFGISIKDLITYELINENPNSVWDKRLIELSTLNLSIKDISRIMGSSTKTIRKSIDRLNIEPFWVDNGGRNIQYGKEFSSEKFFTKREEFRNKWLMILNNNPNLSSNHLRYQSNNNGRIYEWLSKYDIEWLRLSKQQGVPKFDKIDWSERDQTIALEIDELIQIMKNGKGQMITLNTVANRLGYSGWLMKSIEKMPKCKALILRSSETLEEYHVRKLRWAYSDLIEQQLVITKFRLIDKAGVKIRYLDNLLPSLMKSLDSNDQAIYSILADNG